jgi:hypothetical protein
MGSFCLIIGSCLVAAALALAYGESLADAVTIAALFSVIVASHIDMVKL